MNSEQGVEFTVPGGATASETVLDAVAATERTSPSDIVPPLYSVVDPEALDALVESLEGRTGWIEFVYREHLVTVDGSGVISIQPELSKTEE